MINTLAIHHNPNPDADTSLPDSHQDTFSKTILGFWIYLMTDCLLFATFFATYAVLHSSTFGGAPARDLFSLSTAFYETMMLLLSSLTCGLAMLSALQSKKIQVIGWLSISFIFGVVFLSLEFHEFSELFESGNSWRRSAFLSSFFSLVGLHGLHVSTGLLWMAVVMVQVFMSGITVVTFRRLAVFSLFWHFLDLVWIFIFTFVYLMGVL